jgi:nitroimidazol reductase NimA-like FMN-containing flavoprotein (pyridoxamine 5'-phosphate oxidase superfamily)
MDEGQLRRRVAEARVARVGTVDEQGCAHLVPIVFVIDRHMLYSATDADPRQVTLATVTTAVRAARHRHRPGEAWIQACHDRRD